MGFRVFRFLGRFLVLTGFLGSASGMVWHWQGTCGNNNWYSTCSIGSCEGYHTLYANNWGATACGEIPSFPEAGDTVVIPEGAYVIQDGSVEVGRIVIEEGGALDWQVGYLSVSDTLINHGRFLCEGNTADEFFAGVLKNEGTVQDSGGTLQLSADAVLLNDTGALVLLKPGSIDGASDTAYLVNRGILKKTAAGGASLGPRLWVSSAPSGTLQVLEGSLTFYGRFGGRVYLAEGTNAYLYGGARLADTVLFWGTGTLQILENPTVVAGSRVTSALQAPGRVLWNNGTLTIDTGARWINEGEFVARDNITLQGTLENRGTLVKTSASHWRWSDGTTVINDSGGLLDLRAGRIEVASGAQASLINRGTVLRDSAGTVSLYRRVDVQQKGTWQVSTGTLYLYETEFTQDSGRCRVSSLFWSTQPLQFQHGRVEGTGTLRSTVVFQGDTLAPGDSTGATGVLKIQGSVVLGPASVWNEEVGGTGDAGQDFDALQVDGQSQDSVVLQNGVLRVVLVQGYTPSEAGDSVPILTWDSQVTTVRGSFGEVVLANAPSTVSAWLTWGPSALYLHLADTENHTGDVNNDGQVDVLDVEYLANYLYEKGPAPPVPGYADLNGDARVDDQDLVALTHRLWQAR